MTSEEVSAPLRNAQSEAVAVKAEQLREQGVEVLRRLSTAKVSLSDASFIAGWVTDARKALTHPAPPLATPECATCNGSGKEALNSICRDCDEVPAPPLAVTDEMVGRAAEVHWAESFKKTPTEAMRAALTAALEAKQ